MIGRVSYGRWGAIVAMRLVRGCLRSLGGGLRRCLDEDWTLCILELLDGGSFAADYNVLFYLCLFFTSLTYLITLQTNYYAGYVKTNQIDSEQA